MKTIGMLGGMSWESSQMYYKAINEIVRERLGGHHSAKSLMYSVDFNEIKKLQFEGKWNELTDIMIDSVKKLEAGGADFLLICTNTMHMMAREVETAISIPLLHIADATALEIKKRGIKKIGLLGTTFTMEQQFYKGRLEDKHQIEVIVPSEDDRSVIHDIIYEELTLGVVNQTSKESYKKIIDKLVQSGAEGIILGCTEITLLISQDDCMVPVFDTTKIHAEQAVDYALDSST